MADASKAGGKIKSRYMMAIALSLIFIAAVFLVNAAVYFIIINYLPWLYFYIAYATQISGAVVGIVGAYIVYRILASIANLYSKQRGDIGSGEAIKLIFRVLFYFVAILIILTALGVSLSGALAGGAIGGIILGLAVQTVATSILSGFLISSSRTIFPGEVIVIQLSAWGSSVLCKVKKVGHIFTEVTTQNGINVKIPNTALMTSSMFLLLKSGPSYTYTMQVAVNADVPMKDFGKRVDAVLARYNSLKREKLRHEIYLFSKAGGANTYNVVLHFDSFEEVNEIIDAVNNAFDEAYWSLKKPAK